MSLYECLLVRKSMIFLSAVLELMFALILPVEFKVDISPSCGDRKWPISQLYYLLLNLHVVNSFKFGITFKVCCNDFNSHLNKGLNILWRECIFVPFACFCDLDCNLIVIKLLHLLHFSRMFLCLNLLSLWGGHSCQISLLHFYMFKFIWFNYWIHYRFGVLGFWGSASMASYAQKQWNTLEWK